MPNAIKFQYWVNYVINDLIYRYNVYRDLIISDPNYTIINGIPLKRVLRKFSKAQIDSINDYADKNGIDSVKSMHILFD